jgi:branched-chain amino acid transport system permease protein
MFYREAGQFKTSYASDQAIFPILQDKIGIAIILAIAAMSPFRCWEARSSSPR